MRLRDWQAFEQWGAQRVEVAGGLKRFEGEEEARKTGGRVEQRNLLQSLACGSEKEKNIRKVGELGPSLLLNPRS